jgi:hypothetical protein
MQKSSDRQMKALKAKIKDRDSLISEIVADHISLIKS